jgi:hypothetical protein
VAEEWKSMPDGMEQLSLQIRLPRRHLRELLDDLVEIPEVKGVRGETGAAGQGGVRLI